MSVRKRRLLTWLLVLIALAAVLCIVYLCLPGIRANTIAYAGELGSDSTLGGGYSFRRGALGEDTHAVSYYVERWSYGELVSRTCVGGAPSETKAQDFDVGYSIDEETGEHGVFFGETLAPLEEPYFEPLSAFGVAPMLGRLGAKIEPGVSIPLVCVCAWPYSAVPDMPKGLSADSDIAAVSEDIPTLVVLSQVYGAECQEPGEVI